MSIYDFEYDKETSISIPKKEAIFQNLTTVYDNTEYDFLSINKNEFKFSYLTRHNNMNIGHIYLTQIYKYFYKSIFRYENLRKLINSYKNNLFIIYNYDNIYRLKIKKINEKKKLCCVNQNKLTEMLCIYNEFYSGIYLHENFYVYKPFEYKKAFDYINIKLFEFEDDSFNIFKIYFIESHKIKIHRNKYVLRYCRIYTPNHYFYNEIPIYYEQQYGFENFDLYDFFQLH